MPHLSKWVRNWWRRLGAWTPRSVSLARYSSRAIAETAASESKPDVSGGRAERIGESAVQARRRIGTQETSRRPERSQTPPRPRGSLPRGEPAPGDSSRDSPALGLVDPRTKRFPGTSKAVRGPNPEGVERAPAGATRSSPVWCARGAAGRGARSDRGVHRPQT